MSSVRRPVLSSRSVFLLAAVLGCAPAQKTSAPPNAPVEGSAATAGSEPGRARVPAAAAPAPTCRYSVRRLSAYGRGALRPQIAATADAFAVAWEETTDHRSIRVQTFTPEAVPLGSSIEVADVGRAAAAPRISAAADGDGFAVFWTSEHGDGSAAITMRRIDRTGKPKSDAIPVVVAPGARALDVAPSNGGYTLAWWNWSGTPHQLAVSFVDKNGRPAGKALPLTRAPAPDPTVDVAAGATLGRRAASVLAWDELAADGSDHVILGDLGKERLEGRTDLGPGATPRFGAGLVIWERAADATIWSATPGGDATPVRLADGHLPAAAPRGLGATAFCFLHDTDPTGSAHVDDLTCGDLVDGRLTDATRVALEPRGIVGLSLAVTAGRIGVAWQSQQDDDTGISFASLSCPDPAAAAKARE
jgi:hypothetical protein